MEKQRTLSKIGADIDPVIAAAAAAADGTDRAGQWPEKAIQLMRDNGLLGLLVPEEYGGLGGDLRDMVAVAIRFGGACTSTAMIWAMHCQQVDCVVRYGSERLRSELLPRIAAGQVYLGSVTTEPRKAANLLSGRAALIEEGDNLRVERDTPIVTGALHADGFLVTMRTAPEATDNRLTLFYAGRNQLITEVHGTWDTLGMRGTESLGMRLSGFVPRHQIIGEPGEFKTVAVESMIPASHLGWSAVWLGAARAALSEVVTIVRARGSSGQSDILSERIARARMDVEIVSAYLGAVLGEVMHLRETCTSLIGTPTQIHLNNLKVIASELTFAAADRLMSVAGLFAGYKADGGTSLNRIFRDLRSASLNFSNDRLLAINGALSLMDRDVTLLPAGLSDSHYAVTPCAEPVVSRQS